MKKMCTEVMKKICTNIMKKMSTNDVKKMYPKTYSDNSFMPGDGD